MFEDVFEVIFNHMIHVIGLEDFPKQRNTTSQKCVAKLEMGYYTIFGNGVWCAPNKKANVPFSSSETSINYYVKIRHASLPNYSKYSMNVLA